MAGVSAVLLLASGLGTAAGAEDTDGGDDNGATDEPDITVYHDGLTVSTGFEEFEGCPVIMGPDAVGPALCLRLSVSGPLNFGDVDADIEEPMDMVVGLRAGDEEAGIPPQVAMAQDEAGEPDKIEGGLLGVPELDPVFDPVDGLTEDVVDAPVWGIYADPDIDDPDAQIDGLVEVVAILQAFYGLVGLEEGEEISVEDFFALVGAGDAEEYLGDQTLGLPISVHLQNLLFGENCYIGTPDDRINIDLTTGTTEPPEGVEPMTGSYGNLLYEIPDPDRPDLLISRIVGAGFVDNTFPVPGASGCDAVVGGLLEQEQGLADPVINQQTGLPSAAGTNVADFSIDFAVASTNNVYPRAWTGTPTETDFGEIGVGLRTGPQSITIENTGNRPTQFSEVLDGRIVNNFRWYKNTCPGAVLEVGDQCELSLRGAPSSVGTHTETIRFAASTRTDAAGSSEEDVTITVTGIE